MSEEEIRLETIGYADREAEQRIDDFLAQPHAMLVDIRYRPYSRWRPAFNHGALAKRHNKQYHLLLSLGNKNYNDPTKDIVIADPEDGVRNVLRLLDEGHSLMLMCACKDYERCHRKIVYDLVMAALKEREAMSPTNI